MDYISPFGSEGSQTMLALCVVPNPAGSASRPLCRWGRVTGEIDAAVTVQNGALQEIDGKTVVFVVEGDAFEARVVKIGVKDNERVEVISGLRPGERYVAANSFVMKAELGKGEAEHEH